MPTGYEVQFYQDITYIRKNITEINLSLQKLVKILEGKKNA